MLVCKNIVSNHTHDWTGSKFSTKKKKKSYMLRWPHKIFFLRTNHAWFDTNIPIPLNPNYSVRLSSASSPMGDASFFTLSAVLEN